MGRMKITTQNNNSVINSHEMLTKQTDNRWNFHFVCESENGFLSEGEREKRKKSKYRSDKGNIPWLLFSTPVIRYKFRFRG